MAEEKMEVKRVRDVYESPEAEADSPEVKRLRENLLDGLDEDPDFCGSNQELDSFMKRFEEEITAGGREAAGGETDVPSDSGESRPELGYLLEASDDELGIPPPSSEDEFRNSLVRLDSDPSVIGGEFWGSPGLDAFGPGSGGTDNGLLEYSDLGTGSVEYPWRPETLPAQ